MTAAVTQEGKPRRGRPPKKAAAAASNGHGSPTAAVAPELRFTSAPAVVEMEPLFSIDDKVYEVPKTIPVAKALALLNSMRLGTSEMVAIAELFVAVIGEDAFEALTECEGLTGENLDALMRVIRDKAMGELEKVKGE